MFARPSPPSARGFAARPLDRPGGEGLAARCMYMHVNGHVHNLCKFSISRSGSSM